MNIEVLIPSILNSIVGGRVWESSTPDTIPVDTNGQFKDFIIWTQHGGQDAEYVGQTMPQFVNTRVQIVYFSTSGITATNGIRTVRDRLLASDYTVGVYGSPLGTYDAPRKLRGRAQQFGIWYPQ